MYKKKEKLNVFQALKDGYPITSYEWAKGEYIIYDKHKRRIIDQRGENCTQLLTEIFFRQSKYKIYEW
jgi:hypothetical protein